jgi:hypothetical protein
MIRTVAIVVGDSDFENTFLALLESVQRALTDNPSLTKEVVTQAIRSGVAFHYLTHQYKVGLPSREDTEAFLRKHASEIETYLLATMRVLLDEEAEKDIATKDYGGGAWYLDQPTGRVYLY